LSFVAFLTTFQWGYGAVTKPSFEILPRHETTASPPALLNDAVMGALWAPDNGDCDV